MPKNKKNEVLVGAYVLGGIGLALFLVFLMGGLESLFTARSDIRVVFSEIQGLRVGDPVYLFGLEVGSVNAISLLPQTDVTRDIPKLAATLSIPAKLRDYIRETSTVFVDKSITGSLSVVIHGGDAAGARLPDDGELVGQPTADFSAIAGDLDTLLVESRRVIGSVRAIVGDIEEKRALQSAFDRIEELIAAMRSEIAPLTESAKSALESAGSTLESVKRVVDDNEQNLGEVLANLESATALAQGFIARLEETPSKLDASLDALTRAGGAAGTVLTENRLGVARVVRDLAQTVANSSNLSAEVKRRPWRLLYKPDAAEIKALELYDAAWAYNLGAAELERSIEALTGLVAAPIGDSDHAKLIADAVAAVETSLAKHHDAEETFWARLGAAD